jgi:hypothetical protein
MLDCVGEYAIGEYPFDFALFGACIALGVVGSLIFLRLHSFSGS